MLFEEQATFSFSALPMQAVKTQEDRVGSEHHRTSQGHGFC